MKRVHTLICGIIVICVGTFGTPNDGSACIWRPGDRGSPLPPCEKSDSHTQNRIHSVNAQVAGRMAAGMFELQKIKEEVALWREDIEEARSYYEEMREVYGLEGVDPLGAMVAVYNANAPLNNVLTLTEDGFVATVDLNDWREMAREYLYDLRDEVLNDIRFDRTVLASRADEGGTHPGTDYQLAVDGFRTAVNNLEYVTEQATSFRDEAEEIATRYSDVTEIDGMSEARIARLASQLSRVRGTTFEAEMAAMRARARATDLSYRTRTLGIEEGVRRQRGRQYE